MNDLQQRERKCESTRRLKFQFNCLASNRPQMCLQMQCECGGKSQTKYK